MDDLAEPRRADRMRQRARHFGLVGQPLRHLIGHQHAQQVAVGHLDGLHALAESKFQLHVRPSIQASTGNAFAAWRSACTTGSSSPVRKRISAPPPVQM